MYGAMLGDMFGSIYEWNNRKTETPEEIELMDKRCFFTDDSVLTVATAQALLDKTGADGFDYGGEYYAWGHSFPRAGYGGRFCHWLASDVPAPYNSWGNGSAMRVSPVGWAFASLEETLREAKKSAEVSHNHPEGIKGAQATAAAIFLARTGASKADIKTYIEKTFDYNLDRTIAGIRPDYKFDVSCQGAVPEAIIAFLESHDFTSAIQIAISLGGDTDTLACITGGIAEAFYRDIPPEFITFAKSKLKDEMVDVADAFRERYCVTGRV